MRSSRGPKMSTKLQMRTKIQWPRCSNSENGSVNEIFRNNRIYYLFLAKIELCNIII